MVFVALPLCIRTLIPGEANLGLVEDGAKDERIKYSCEKFAHLDNIMRSWDGDFSEQFPRTVRTDSWTTSECRVGHEREEAEHLAKNLMARFHCLPCSFPS